MQEITPCLWFDTQAEEAANFYTSIFPNSKVTEVSHYNDAGPRPAGMVLAVSFVLDGREFVGLNGGPEFTFSEAVSFQVPCDSQEELDEYWDKLLADGGEPGPCGWLKDRFGVSWQVFPAEMLTLLSDPDQGRAARAMAAMMKQSKIDLAAIKRAVDEG
jgi:predicted 3-demethylubiquinone-9 3-methyltransferase (glyoxalase superfamily)